MNSSKTVGKPFRAEDLIGKTWMYQGNTIKVFRIEDEGKAIVTDKKTYRFSSTEETLAFCKECLPMADQPGENLPAKNGSGMVVFKADTGSSDLFEQLLGELKDDFDLLKTDKNYVPQARERGNHITRMVSLAKLRLQLLKQNGTL